MDTMTNTTNNTPNFYPAGLKFMGKVYDERKKALKRRDFTSLEFTLDLGIWANKTFFNPKFPNRKARLIEYAQIKYPNNYEGTMSVVVSVLEVLHELNKRHIGKDEKISQYDYLRYVPMCTKHEDGSCGISTLMMRATKSERGVVKDTPLWRGTQTWDSILAVGNMNIASMLIGIMREELLEVLPQIGLQDVKQPE